MNFEWFESYVKRTIDDGGGKRRQALRYLLDHPNDVAMLSMRKLATRAKVSPATMLKIATESNFQTFAEFKAIFQEHVLGTHDFFSVGAKSMLDQRDPLSLSNLVLKIAKTDLENIEETLNQEGYQRIEMAVDKILAAERVFIVGMRACFSVAHYLHYSMSLVKENVELIDTAAGRLGDRVIKMKSPDVLIAIGFYPYVNSTLNVVKYAQRVGTRVIAITDNTSSPMIGREDDALIFSSKSPWVIGSITSAIVLSQALVANIVLRDGEKALKKISALEKELDAFDIFFNP